MEKQFTDFQADVIDASNKTPVVVDFWAPWCGPCKMLSPVLEKLARSSGNKWQLIKINTEAHPQLAAQMQIRSIPSVKMYSEGKEIADFAGAMPEHAIVRWLELNLPTKTKKTLEAAERLIETNRKEAAIQLLEDSLATNGDDPDVRVVLAQALFDRDLERAHKLVEDLDESHPKWDYIDALKTLYRLENEYNDFKKNVNGEQKSAWKMYVKGIEGLRTGELEKALESWIDVLPVDRNLDDDGARKACAALFKLLGPNHELTRKYHRQFTSALF